MLVLAFYLVSFSVELLISARLTCCILPDLFLVNLLTSPADGIHSYIVYTYLSLVVSVRYFFSSIRPENCALWFLQLNFHALRVSKKIDGPQPPNCLSKLSLLEENTSILTIRVEAPIK